MDKSRLPVDNCGRTVHKVATRALEDVTGGLSLWISTRKPVISGIWPVDKSVDKSGWPSVRFIRPSCPFFCLSVPVRVSCILSVRPFFHPYKVSVDKPHNVLLINDLCDS